MKRIITKYWWVLPCLLGSLLLIDAGLHTWLYAAVWSVKIKVMFLRLILYVVLILTIIALLISWNMLLSSKQWRKFLISLLLLVVAILLSLKPLSSAYKTPPSDYDCDYECDSLYVESDMLFCMDSTEIKLSLMKPYSLVSIFMLQVDQFMINDFQYGEGIYVSNSSENEFVFMKLNNGRIGQEFDAFILTDSIPSEFSMHTIHSKALKFTTTYGAHIGISKTDFANNYFKDNKAPTEFGLEYARYDSINSLYNKYYFKNDTLKRIEIGYDW